MKSRLFASVAVCVAVALGASGCAMLSPQGTTIQYSPGDGIDVADAPGAPLQVRNALIVATPDGQTGNLLAGIVNTSGLPQTLSVEIGSGSDTVTKTITVTKQDVTSLGGNADPLRIDDLNVKPGATVPVYFQSGSAEGAKADVPVLGGEEDYLQSFVPSPQISPVD